LITAVTSFTGRPLGGWSDWPAGHARWPPGSRTVQFVCRFPVRSEVDAAHLVVPGDPEADGLFDEQPEQPGHRERKCEDDAGPPWLVYRAG